MNAVNTPYSLVFQCDNRSFLCVGLSLVVAIATAVALGVLAHYGHITPTTAYGAALPIGAVLTMISVASALIRKDTPSKSPQTDAEVVIDPSKGANVQNSTQIEKSLNVAIKVQIVPYSKTPAKYVRQQGPTQDAPYHYLKVQIALEGVAEHVEVEIVEIHRYGPTSCKMTFRYAETDYIKDIVNATKLETLWKEHIRNENNLLFREDYKRLKDPRGPATLFIVSEESGRAFFDREKFSEVTHENNVITFARSTATPIRSLQGLNQFPEICAQLQALSWKWEAPQEINLVGLGERLPVDLLQEKWIYPLRVEWHTPIMG